AGGTAALAQRVLEAVFGDDAVRRLAKKAKADLDARVEALMAAELRRYHELLDSVSMDHDRAAAIRAAAGEVEAARAEADGLPGEVEVARERVDLSIADEGPRALPAEGAGEPYALEAGPGDIVDAEIVERRDGARDGR
ncbi:MAG: ABC transporter, partial [Propionibacteriaceae bacterium]|nr:ABC transporter [Propionibacteriaceae bacterium]